MCIRDRLNRVPVVWIRSTALVLALAVGYIAAAYMGRLDFTGAREAALFQVPMPLHFGLGFSWALFVPMLIIYLVLSLIHISIVAGDQARPGIRLQARLGHAQPQACRQLHHQGFIERR